MSTSNDGAFGAVRVGCYPTAKSLPLHVGIDNGFFERAGVSATLHFHDNSRLQRDGLAGGEFDVVHMAVDNAVSMVEDDGEDVIVLCGGDSGMNEFFVQPEIASFADLRGKRFVVDAVDTAYALQAIRILAEHGLEPGRDYELDPVGRGELRVEAMKADKAAAGSVLNPPYSFQAEDAGLKSLGSTAAMIGGYQASGAFALRAWAEQNRDLLVRYLAAYLAALRWVRNPANSAACEGLLRDRLGMSPSIARRTYSQLVDPQTGFTADAGFDMAGFDNVLSLRRSTMTTGGKNPVTSDTIVDLSYYREAIAKLEQAGS